MWPPSRSLAATLVTPVDAVKGPYDRWRGHAELDRTYRLGCARVHAAPGGRRRRFPGVVPGATGRAGLPPRLRLTVLPPAPRAVARRLRALHCPRRRGDRDLGRRSRRGGAL